MNIQFKTVKISNFFSIGYAEVDLENMGYVAVEGVNNCKYDNAKSNGAGKSSVFAAVCQCITGSTPKGLTKGFENKNGDPNNCWVEVEMTIDSNEYTIRRIQTPTKNLKIWKNGADISGKTLTESRKVFAQEFGDLNADVVGSIIILGQGLPHKFSAEEPSKRKELLEHLTGSDFMIEDIKNRVSIRDNQLTEELSDVKGKVREETAKVEVLQRRLERNKLKLSSYPDNIDEKIDEYEKSVRNNKEELTEEHNKYDEIGDELDKLSGEIDKLYDKKDEDLKNMTGALNDEKSSIWTKRAEDYSEMMSLARKIKDIDNMSDTCPTCGQKLINFVRPDTTEMKSKGAELKQKISEYDNKIDEIDGKISKISEDLFNKLKEDKGKLSQKSSGLDNEARECRAKISSLNLSLVSEERELSRLKSLKDVYADTVRDVEEETKEIEELNDEINKTSKDQERLEGHKTVLGSLKNLASREFRGILLADIVKVLDAKAKEYCDIIFGTELIKIEQVGNDIDIEYNGKQYETLSGGEAQKVDVIVQLALRDILSKYRGFHSNMLVVDEVFDNMDAAGCEGTIKLLSSLNDLTSVFIISHHGHELGIPYDRKMIVTKSEDEVSSVRFN